MQPDLDNVVPTRNMIGKGNAEKSTVSTATMLLAGHPCYAESSIILHARVNMVNLFF